MTGQRETGVELANHESLFLWHSMHLKETSIRMYLWCVPKSMCDQKSIHDDNYSDAVQMLGFVESGPKMSSKKAAWTGQKMTISQAAALKTVFYS